jgi:phage recombination protein Bet
MAETQTRNKTTEAPQTAPRNGDVIISAERLPMPIGVQERFGVDRSAWRALTDAVFPLAKTPGAIVLALAYCRARKLDIFKRVVHIVPMWNEELNRNVETVWPGIAEARITATRTGAYAGNDAVEFGEWQSKRFVDEKVTRKGKKLKADVSMDFPEWARMTVYKIVQGQRVAFVGPVIRFEEFFGYRSGLAVPNARWQRAPSQMLEKCCEAAALRRAFPEEFGDEAFAEEMDGRTIKAGGSPIGPGEPEPKRTDFKADRGVPKDGVTMIADPGEDDDELEDGVEVLDDASHETKDSDQKATTESVVAKTKETEPKREQTKVAEAQGSPQADDRAPPSDQAPKETTTDDAPPPAQPEAKSPEDEFDEMVRTCIESIGGIDDVQTLKEYQRRVRTNIDNAKGVSSAKRDRSRGRLNAACMERERELNRGAKK